jgi:hypothetical protein
MIRCEYCTRRLGANEIAHGIRYGTVDHATDVFLPDRDSAPTVICQHCGEMILKLIYVKLNRTNTCPTTCKTSLQTR